MLLPLSLGIIAVFSMQFLFPLDVVVVFLNVALPFWRGCFCSSSTSLLILSP